MIWFISSINIPAGRNVAFRQPLLWCHSTGELIIPERCGCWFSVYYSPWFVIWQERRGEVTNCVMIRLITPLYTSQPLHTNTNTDWNNTCLTGDHTMDNKIIPQLIPKSKKPPVSTSSLTSCQVCVVVKKSISIKTDWHPDLWPALSEYLKVCTLLSAQCCWLFYLTAWSGCPVCYCSPPGEPDISPLLPPEVVAALQYNIWTILTAYKS